MRDTKRAIQSTRSGDSDPVKPVPPADLWDRLAAFNVVYDKPRGAFTVTEYATQFGMNDSATRRRLNALVGEGKIEKVGKWYRLKENSDAS